MMKPVMSTLLIMAAITINTDFAQADQPSASSLSAPVAAAPPVNQMDDKKIQDRMGMVEKHLEHVKNVLKITPEQEAAWQAYTTKVKTKVKVMIAERDRMRQERGNTSITTPERMEDMAKSLNRRAEEMSEMAEVTKALYVKLTTQQRLQFDNIAQQETKRYNEMMRRGTANHTMSTPSTVAQPAAIPVDK